MKDVLLPIAVVGQGVVFVALWMWLSDKRRRPNLVTRYLDVLNDEKFRLAWSLKLIGGIGRIAQAMGFLFFALTWYASYFCLELYFGPFESEYETDGAPTGTVLSLGLGFWLGMGTTVLFLDPLGRLLDYIKERLEDRDSELKAEAWSKMLRGSRERSEASGSESQ